MSAAVTEDASAVEALGPAWEAVDGRVKFRIPLDQGAEGVKWFAPERTKSTCRRRT